MMALRMMAVCSSLLPDSCNSTFGCAWREGQCFHKDPSNCSSVSCDVGSGMCLAEVACKSTNHCEALSRADCDSPCSKKIFGCQTPAGFCDEPAESCPVDVVTGGSVCQTTTESCSVNPAYCSAAAEHACLATQGCGWQTGSCLGCDDMDPADCPSSMGCYLDGVACRTVSHCAECSSDDCCQSFGGCQWSGGSCTEGSTEVPPTTAVATTTAAPTIPVSSEPVTIHSTSPALCSSTDEASCLANDSCMWTLIADAGTCTEDLGFCPSHNMTTCTGVCTLTNHRCRMNQSVQEAICNQYTSWLTDLIPCNNEPGCAWNTAGVRCDPDASHCAGQPFDTCASDRCVQAADCTTNSTAISCQSLHTDDLCLSARPGCLWSGPPSRYLCQPLHCPLLTSEDACATHATCQWSEGLCQEAHECHLCRDEACCRAVNDPQGDCEFDYGLCGLQGTLSACSTASVDECGEGDFFGCSLGGYGHPCTSTVCAAYSSPAACSQESSCYWNDGACSDVAACEDCSDVNCCSGVGECHWTPATLTDNSRGTCTTPDWCDAATPAECGRGDFFGCTALEPEHKSTCEVDLHYCETSAEACDLSSGLCFLEEKQEVCDAIVDLETDCSEVEWFEPGKCVSRGGCMWVSSTNSCVAEPDYCAQLSLYECGQGESKGRCKRQSFSCQPEATFEPNCTGELQHACLSKAACFWNGPQIDTLCIQTNCSSLVVRDTCLSEPSCHWNGAHCADVAQCKHCRDHDCCRTLPDCHWSVIDKCHVPSDTQYNNATGLKLSLLYFLAWILF